MNNPMTENLILELTRRCNMNCAHCLRGHCQNHDMTFEIAKKAIDQFDYINSITFSGGEPTLCEDLIEKIVDYIISNNINVQGFYMASNGMNVSMKTMFALSNLYGYIYRNYGVDEYQCTFDISLDQYHNSISDMNKGILHSFSFVSERGNIPERGVISEGLANDNGIGCRYLNHYETFDVDDCGDYNCYSMVYVNAKGNILPCCDFSYETQDYLSCINICDDTFDNLANRYNDMIVSK